MNIAALERDLKSTQEAAASLFKSQMDAAEKEQRERTAEEKAEVQALLDKGADFKARIERAKAEQAQGDAIRNLTAGMEFRQQEQQRQTAAAPEQSGRILSLGEQFVQSSAYDFIKAGGHRSGSAWRTPSAELMATTLDESTGSGGYLLTPDYKPGILPLLFKRLTVADLLAPGATDSTTITYMRETTFTNAAAPVAEGGTKPESALVFDQVSDAVRKIAHWLPVTEEMLEDVSAIRSYIDQRLRFGVELTEEDQLLNGSGTPPAITGLLNRSGLTTAVARGTDTTPDAIFKQITAIATTAFIQPDAIVMNPANWQTVQLMKDSNGQYYGSGPFSGAQNPMLWGLKVVVTPSIVANTALVGAFRQCAQMFRKGGMRVEASNSHNDYFIKNLVAIRAEERLALAVYRPAGFGKVTGLN